MPTFCRHNRLIQNCPICSRERAIEMRPVISSSAPGSASRREAAAGASPIRPAPRRAGARGGGGVTVRQLARGADDGYRCGLVPGLKSSADAERLAGELAFAATRVRLLERAPPGLYAEVAGAAEIDERTWLAFLIAYICPVDGPEPFAQIEAVRTTWASGELPELAGVQAGPRTAHDPARGGQTLEAYRSWVRRAGSQAEAFAGEAGWTPERRFSRQFERLGLPGLHRGARFELLLSLGRLGVYEMRAVSLGLGGENEVTVAAKRLLGIGDSLLLERRAAELARAGGIPLEALDLGLHNWESGERATVGLGEDREPDAGVLARLLAALEL
jgi:hypothetical protein